MKRLSIAVSLAASMWACGNPTAPGPFASLPFVPPPATPTPIPPPTRLMTFFDGASGLSTSDVRDVHDQIVRFNSAGELIWTLDDRHFKSYPVNGNTIRGPGQNDWFQIYFGTKDGERRAYLGWDEAWCHCPGYPPSIIDVEVVDGRVIFRATDVLVPRP